MKSYWRVSLVVIGLILSLAGGASAQDAPPHQAGPYILAVPSDPTPAISTPDLYVERFPTSRCRADSPSAQPAVPIGQPGLSYRYERTYGETRTAYLADNYHLFRPWGVAVDPAGNVYITEQQGHRMVKYSANGDYLMSIGKAGDWIANNTDRIASPRGVAVDGGGNIWIAEGANRVTKWDATGKYVSQLGQTWNEGGDNGRFRWPNGIVFGAAGRLHVVDPGNQRIQVFDSAGNYSFTIGSGSCGLANNQFCDTQGIAADSAGRVYVADQGNHRVQIFNATGDYLTTLGVSGTCGQANHQLCNPSGVATGPDGKVYVADSRNNRVQVFTPYPGLSYIGTIGVTGEWGRDNAHLGWVIGVAVDAAGNVYVVEEDNSRVQKFDSNRNHVRTFGVTGVPYLTDELHLANPVDAAVDAAGYLVVLEQAGQRFVKYDPNGAPLFSVGDPGNPGWDEDGICFPSGVAADGSGRIYLTGGCSHRIQIYSSGGAYLASIGAGYGTGNTEFKHASGIVVGSDGHIYVADTDNHRIQVYDSGYHYVATIGQTGVAGSDNAHFNRPMRPALDQAGNLYVPDANNYRVQKCTPAGQCTTFAGTTGESGWDNDHFSEPDGVAVDSLGRVYVVDQHNGRIQVYDQNGAYLTTVGGSRGTLSGQNQNPVAVEVDGAGNVYIVDSGNQRVQKWAPGVPGWKQINVNGFGDRRTTWISSLRPFQGALYAAGYPARVWRLTAAGTWSQVNVDGFGDTTNNEIDALAEFNGQLYAATYTWVCDDSNCNTGHTNGPQVWRSANGTDWQNVTPAEGIGSGDRYVTSFVVFKGYLYAGLGADATHGSEVWRTADGLGWTRVAENGFANDVYNYGALSLAVYNDNLYAGTARGDWYADSHPDGPLGGEVWRTSDGTSWVQVNSPGFGNLEAHRVETLIVFQNALYAYVSHAGGTGAGADVWRCTKVLCSEQGDWTRVAENGFGVPQNQYLYAGAVSGNYLYAPVSNGTTGMQLWRTADGANWEKATPFDGLGNSNNAYVYRGAAIDFDGRLTLGITNGASGAGVWQKTLTADFTAMPRRGQAPLTVHFTNTSAGDYTTSEWDFGDGEKSTEANPSHTYTKVGMYSVTLEVGDGVDSSSLTKPAYVDTRLSVYLPLIMRMSDLYDDFNNPTWDGSFDPAKWSYGGAGWTSIRQQSGVLVVQNSTPSEVGGGEIQAAHDIPRSPSRTWALDVRVKMSSDRNGGWTSIQPKVHRPVNGHGWTALCSLGGAQGLQSALFDCGILVGQGNDWTHEYQTGQTPVAYDTWHTAKIEIASGTAEVRFYLDGQLVGRHAPNDADALKTATSVLPAIALWNGDANATATRFADDVRITPAK